MHNLNLENYKKRHIFLSDLIVFACNIFFHLFFSPDPKIYILLRYQKSKSKGIPFALLFGLVNDGPSSCLKCWAANSHSSCSSDIRAKRFVGILLKCWNTVLLLFHPVLSVPQHCAAKHSVWLDILIDGNMYHSKKIYFSCSAISMYICVLLQGQYSWECSQWVLFEVAYDSDFVIYLPWKLFI